MFFGDEGNDGAKLDGYAKVDIRTSYNVTENVQIYGMVDNVFDSRYGLFGNFFNQEVGQQRRYGGWASGRTTSGRGRS